MRFEQIGRRPALSSARLRRNLLSGACAVAAAVASFAQEVASEVSTEQVKSYQLGLEAGCKRVGRNRGEESEKVDAYCGCVMRVLRENATPSQWRHANAIGTELQRMRALMLLAQVHAQAGLGATALAYAEEMSSYFLSAPSTPDWEVAFTHVVHAHAASTAGAQSQHAQSYARAAQALAAIAEAEDRAIIERVFRNVPAP